MLMTVRLRVALALAATTLLCACTSTETDRPESIAGTWRATLELPGGELPFFIEITEGDEIVDAVVINGAERVPVDDVSFDGSMLALSFPAFNNRIDARLEDGELQGALTLIKSGGKVQVMPLHARRGAAYRFRENPRVAADFSGRWAVEFREEDGSRSAAVAEFRQDGDVVSGTFMTPTGDYRYLAGQADDKELLLSTFDGAHAFLFRASIGEDDTLQGDFWSGTAWHETWTARRDASAALPDADTLTFLKPGYDRVAFTFPDTDGVAVSLDDPRFAGKVVLVTLNGTWCPNCHDEAAFLARFYERYRDSGLEIIALMYEHFDDFETAATQVERMRDKYAIAYSMLLAGTSSKVKAQETLPMLNQVLAFPTSIFIDRSGKVRRIHTGFTGPGTGEHYEELTRDFTATVEQLLSESVADEMVNGTASAEEG